VREPSVCHFMLLTQIFLRMNAIHVGTILGMYTGFYTLGKHTTIPSLGLVVPAFGAGLLGGNMGMNFPKTTKALAVVLPAYALFCYTEQKPA
jgi:hypothetical protein